MSIAAHVTLFCGVALALSLANTVGYHRMLAHRAFKAHPVVRYTLTFLSALHSGSPILWVGLHHVHHRFSDRDGDPHTPKDYGFMYGHVGWLFDTKSVPVNVLLTFSGFALQLRYLYQDILVLTGKLEPRRHETCKDLANDPFMAFLDRPLVIPALFAAQVAVAWWIAAWWGILWLWGMHVFQNNASWVINAFHHTETFGYNNPKSRDGSRDVPWLAWITNGDSYHNLHHIYPASAKAALNGGWDPSWWLICVLVRLGLARDVRLPIGYTSYPGWMEKKLLRPLLAPEPESNAIGQQQLRPAI
jgi:stearoyl-CoA desaturase (delta-9 desaturase)